MKELFLMFRKKDDMDEIFEQTFNVMKKEYDMLKEVIYILRKTDKSETKIDIKKEDKKINKFQMEARKKIFTELAISGAENLNAGLVLMSIIIDVERLGDYAKNIIELAKVHPKKLKGGELEESVKDIEEKMNFIFEKTLDAFKNKDEDTAREAMEMHPKVTRVVEELLMILLENKAGGLNAGEAVALTLYLRFIKRITSHLTNIASSVVNPLERIGYIE